MGTVGSGSVSRDEIRVCVFKLNSISTGGEGETVETPCVACRCVVLPNLQRCVLLTTYGGPPATAPGPLPPLRVTSPDCPTRSYPRRHNVLVTYLRGGRIWSTGNGYS